jgi:ceramide glucosyltransferase
VLGRMAFRDVFARQVRWSRTHRVSRPGGYAGAFIRHGVLLSLLLLLVQGPTVLSLGALASTLALRLAVVVVVTTKVLRAPDPARGLWLLPVADLLNLLFWALAYTGNTVTWRGRRYRVTDGGHLDPVDRA